MDLVDIDKVLDDLEFDENKIALKSSQKQQQQQHQPSKSQILENTFNNIQQRSETNKNINSEKNSTIGSNSSKELKFDGNSTSLNNKNNGNLRIVAVSQVFNSLDEYRKDVESLRIDLDKINSSKYSDKFNLEQQQFSDSYKSDNIGGQLQSQQNVQSMESNSTTVNEATTTKSSNLSSINSKSSLIDLNQTNLKFLQSNDDDDDLKQFIEYDDSINDGLTSTSSITTSSASSFSSGPSPHSPSSPFSGGNDLSSSLLITSKNIQLPNEKSNPNVNKNSYSIKQDQKAEQQCSNNKEIKSQITSSNIGNDDDDDNLEDSNEQNSIDLVGLSSISTSLYIENSISSAQVEQQNINNKFINLPNNIELYNESQNEINSLICRQLNLPCKNKEISIDHDRISTSSAKSELIIRNCDINNEYLNNFKDQQDYINTSKQNESKQEDNLVHVNIKRNLNHEDKRKIEEEFKSQNEFVQKSNEKLPITFGSTVDEISDTELDSMLQDIDNELQNNGVIKEKIHIKSETFEKIDSSSSCEQEESNKIKMILNANNKITNIENNKLEQSKDSQIKLTPATSTLNKDDQLIQLTPSTPQNNICTENMDEMKMNIKIMDEDMNLQNADSFSQASTIEFADLQSQNDLRIVGCDIESNCNDNASNLDKVKKIKNVENLNDKKNEKQQNSSANKINSSEIEVLENSNDNKINEKNNISKRPKLLNLTETAEIGIVSKAKLSDFESDDSSINILNIDGTAGQTPPAYAITNLNNQMSSDNVVVDDSREINLNENPCNEIENYQENSSDNISDDINNFSIANTCTRGTTTINYQLGKIPPFWIPDCEASFCMQCKVKFSLIKRRHHCRACGHVLCSLCCSQKAKLEFLGNESEVRVCVQCHMIINSNLESNNIDNSDNQSIESISSELGAVGGVISNNQNAICTGGTRVNSNNFQVTRSPNPNNPMEYCSTIPPFEQAKKNQLSNKPISVMVPVGVLKREGTLSKNRKDKNVIFSDGIRPGCDLADLDNSRWTTKNISLSKKNNHDKEYIPPANPRILRKILPICDENNSYIPKEINALPPIYEKLVKSNEYDYKEVVNNSSLIERLKSECLKFAVQRNFYVYVKIVKLTCCVNKTVINFTTQGMHHVGQDEIIILLEYDNSNLIPKDIFVHLNEIYRDADKGHPITELGYSIAKQMNFLCHSGSGSSGSTALSTQTISSSINGGFLYIRSTFQCLQEIHLPESPFLIGILIHRWEIPWAKIFPLRLMLRLGAQYRYYPSPHLSIRGRKSVYAEIAQTIINFLADFRNYSYTIPVIKGMFIHMEDRKTSVLIPKNRLDQIIKALNNSSDHILALGGNFSKNADGHLVCIQNLESDSPDTHTYSTQAINIQGQPRRVTGASFIVLNGALKTNSGLSGKCSIVEDGLMVHILSQKMQSIRKNLKNMKDIEIQCGPVEADESQTEMVSIQWIDDDTEFNIGVKSPIDEKKLDGISSIRVHSGLNYTNSNFVIRWTEVFLIQSTTETTHRKIAIDISKISEQIARSASTALVPLLDLLAASGCTKIGLRVTLHQDNVCYEAGSKNFKLAPLYMNALDNELIQILHKQATIYEINNPIILELIFHILHK